MNVLANNGLRPDLVVGAAAFIGVASVVLAAAARRLRVAFLLALLTVFLTGAAGIGGLVTDSSGGGISASGGALVPVSGPAPASTTAGISEIVASSAADGGVSGISLALTIVGAILVLLGTAMWAPWFRRLERRAGHDDTGADRPGPGRGQGLRGGRRRGPGKRWNPDPTAVRWTHTPLPSPRHHSDGPPGGGEPLSEPFDWCPFHEHLNILEPAVTEDDTPPPGDVLDLPVGPEDTPTFPAPPAGARLAHEDPFFENLAARIGRIFNQYMHAVTPRPGRPAHIDAHAPEARHFVCALNTTMDLLGGQAPAARLDSLVAAVRETERRWEVVGARSGLSASGTLASRKNPGPGMAAKGDLGARPAVAKHRIHIPPRRTAPPIPPTPPTPPTPTGAEGGGQGPGPVRRRPGEYPPGSQPRPRPDRQ